MNADLHARIAAALNWPIEDAQAFSLQALRDLLRLVNPELAHEVGQAIAGALRGAGEPIRIAYVHACDNCGTTAGMEKDQILCLDCRAYLESRRGNDNGWGDGGWES